MIKQRMFDIYAKLREKILLNYSILVILSLFTNCEGSKCGKGTVRDAITDKPLDSVLCKIDRKNSTTQVYTDSVGKFELCGPFGGCVPDCPDINIEFTKKGYKTQIITNPWEEIIRLEKE